MSLFFQSEAQNSDSAAFKLIADEILLHGKAYEQLKFLCKEVGPRLSGSAQMLRAEKETYKMLKDIGADTVWMQETKVPNWVRGEKELAILTLANGKKQALNICALGNSVGTGPKGILAPVVEVKSFEELKELGVQGIKGKIVYLNIRLNPTYIITDQAYAEASHFRWEGASLSAKYGALAFMIRSLASNTDDYPHTGGMAYNDSFPKIPALAVSTRDGDRISEALAMKKGLTLFIRNSSATFPDAIGHNVIAELRGTEFPDEIITVGGHLDSWDLAEGAQDDGAGVVQSMEVMRVFKASGIRPKRTLRVVLFTDEENRGSGGIEYAAFVKSEKKQHVFALESDAGGFTPRYFDAGVTAARISKMRSWLPLFIPYGVSEIKEGETGADIEYLRPQGVSLAENAPDSQRYFDYHHTSLDRFEIVSKRELEMGAIVMAQLVFMVDKYGL